MNRWHKNIYSNNKKERYEFSSEVQNYNNNPIRRYTNLGKTGFVGLSRFVFSRESRDEAGAGTEQRLPARSVVDKAVRISGKVLSVLVACI